MLHEPGTPLTAILERLLVSERPCGEGVNSYCFYFVSDTGKALFLEVTRDYSNNPQFGEWVIREVQIED